MTTTRELVAAACPQIGSVGPAFYFTPATLVVGREHGLDGFRFYFLGRGGVLGDVEPAVIASAFGYFHPDLVADMWTSARARSALTPREAGRRYLQCAHEFGRRHFSGLAGLGGFCAAAETVNDAADPAGLALYAGLAAEPLANDLPARAMQLAAVLREFRGSAHLLAILATPGIEPRVAHGLRRPAMWTAFGYDERDLPEGTGAQRAALAAADDLTDRLVEGAFAALDDAGTAALLTGLKAMEGALPPPSGPRQ